MTTALAALGRRLQAFSAGLAPGPQWQAGDAMAETLAAVRGRHRRRLRADQRARIAASVADYLDSGRITRPDDVSELCFGAGWLDAAGRGILADAPLRSQLFALAETVKGRPRRQKALRGLLFAYWSFPLHDAATPPAAQDGWLELRAWLKRRHGEIARHPARKPSWFLALAPHLHLLDENPCAPYAEALLRGSTDELQRAIDCLFIPAGSWLKLEAVIAPIAAADDWPDELLRERLPALMALATGAAGMRVTAAVTRRALARLVVRYARQREPAPHEALFALALAHLGNPWRQRAAWDAELRDADANAAAAAREMVSAWLKDRIIEAFFADRGRAESRCDFWLPYSVFMQALTLATAAPDVTAGPGAALLLHVGEVLVLVPQDAGRPIEAHAWQAVCSRGGARLLDEDTVDGSAVARILAGLVPAMRLDQAGRARCERALRGVLF